METDIRSRQSAVVKQLGRDISGWEFYAAVREIENNFTDMPRIGNSCAKADDPVHFGQQPELCFSPSELSRLETKGKNGGLLALTSLFGLSGSDGPLPLHLTELAQSRQAHHDDPTLARFMDVFNHRMISFYYRSWALNEQAVSHDRADDDWFQKAVAALAGLEDDSFEDRDSLSLNEKLDWTGRLVAPTRNAEGLVEILKGVLNQPVTLVPFVEKWIDLPDDCLCKLGQQNSAVLGQTAVMGERFFEATQKFRIEIGPLDLEAYESLLPGSVLYDKLNDWIQTYGADPLYCELVLILKQDEQPECRLGEYGKMGHNTWLGQSRNNDVMNHFSKELF